MEVKTFIHALSLFPKDLPRFRRYLSDQRLTQSERKILQGWLDLRDGNFTKIISEVGSLSPNNEVVLSQKELLLAVALNNNGDPQKAVPKFLAAKELLKKFDLPKQMFLVHSNLFVAYSNLKDREGMKSTLEVLEQTLNPTDAQKIQILRYKCNFHGFTGDLVETAKHLRDLEVMASQMSESQKSGILLDQFVFHLKQDDFVQCEAILEKMKAHRTFKLTANFKFMQKLLKFITQDGAIYLYPKDFIAHPILFHQVSVLLSLEKRDQPQAQKSWDYLHHLAPFVYQKGFDYHGDKCLFSMALAKLRPAAPVAAPKTGGRFEDQIIQVLEAYEGNPVSKEELFRQVYGKELSTKDDLNKLTCAVYRIKNKMGVQIRSKKGCYLLENSSIRKKSA